VKPVDRVKHCCFAAVLLMFLSACSDAPAAYESHPESHATAASHDFTPPSVTLAQRTAFDVAVVDKKLASDQTYMISVLGDSTGDARNEWVHLLAKRIAADYHRQVTVHDWNTDAGTYDKDTVYGSGAPVTIWNASGPGRSAQWSAQNFPAMVPHPVDLTIINHGHNDPRDAIAGIADLLNMAYATGTGGVVVLTQNPRADNPDRARMEADLYQQVDATFNDRRLGAMVIDVYSAFPAGDALLGMLNADHIHPNDAGQRVWVDTVASGLQLR
jgi:lysophospholipase L1-like esterase